MHCETLVLDEAHEAISRIGDQRRAGIRHQSHAPAPRQAGAYSLQGAFIAVVVVRHGGRIDGEMLEQALAVSGVFRCYQLYSTQYFDSALRHITKVTDGCCDDIKPGVHNFPL